MKREEEILRRRAGAIERGATGRQGEGERGRQGEGATGRQRDGGCSGSLFRSIALSLLPSFTHKTVTFAGRQKMIHKLSMEELNRKSVQEFREAEKTPLVLVLDNIRSMHNVGSVFRTADAFLLRGIYLCGYTGRPPHRDIHKTALGATETVDWIYFPAVVDAVNDLKQKGYAVWAVEQAREAVLLQHFQPPGEQPLAVVFGNEVHGVGEEVLPLTDGCIEIPQYGMKHSLNISVSAGIVVWDLAMKMKKEAESQRRKA